MLCCRKKKQRVGLIDSRPKAKILTAPVPILVDSKIPEDKKILFNNGTDGQNGTHIRRTVAKRKSNGGTFYGIQIVRKQTEQEKPVDGDGIDLRKSPENRSPQNSPKKIKIPVKKITKMPFPFKEDNDWDLKSSNTNGRKDQSGIQESNANAEPNLSERKSISSIIEFDVSNQKQAKRLPSFGDLEDPPPEDNASYLSPDKEKVAGYRGSLQLSNMKGISKSHSPQRGRSGGYRTLPYKDLLSHKISESAYQKGLTSQFSSHDSLGTHFTPRIERSPSRSNSGSVSQQSLMVNEGDAINDINRTEYSNLDFSILPCGENSPRSITPSKKSLEIVEKAKQELEEQEGENAGNSKFNKDLNTVYVRSSEINARRSSQIVGFVVTGKRTKINQYVLVSSIGKGGWGEVFMAIDVITKVKYAMKVINRSTLRSRLSSNHINDAVRSEIAIMKTLNHPNIVKLYEALEDEQTKKIYLVLEYCSKGSLMSKEFWKANANSKNNFLEEDARETDQQRLSFKQAKTYFIQIARGLHFRSFP